MGGGFSSHNTIGLNRQNGNDSVTLSEQNRMATAYIEVSDRLPAFSLIR